MNSNDAQYALRANISHPALTAEPLGFFLFHFERLPKEKQQAAMRNKRFANCVLALYPTIPEFNPDDDQRWILAYGLLRIADEAFDVFKTTEEISDETTAASEG